MFKDEQDKANEKAREDREITQDIPDLAVPPSQPEEPVLPNPEVSAPPEPETDIPDIGEKIDRLKPEPIDRNRALEGESVAQTVTRIMREDAEKTQKPAEEPDPDDPPVVRDLENVGLGQEELIGRDLLDSVKKLIATATANALESVDAVREDLESLRGEALGDIPEGKVEEYTWAFRVYVFPTSDGMKVDVRGGRRVAYGSDDHQGWEDVDPPDEYFDYVPGHSVYMTWTNTTPAAAGAWNDGGVLYGIPPDPSEGVQVIEIASISDEGGIEYRHIGNVVVTDVRAVLGDPKPFKVIALRQYDASGALVAPKDTAISSLPSGHNLFDTYDYVRVHA